LTSFHHLLLHSFRVDTFNVENCLFYFPVGVPGFQPTFIFPVGVLEVTLSLDGRCPWKIFEISLLSHSVVKQMVFHPRYCRGKDKLQYMAASGHIVNGRCE